MTALCVTSGAAGIASSSKGAITSGKAVSLYLNKSSGAVYKLNVKGSARYVIFSLDSKMWKTYMFFYDANGSQIQADNVTSSIGSADKVSSTSAANSGRSSDGTCAVMYRDEGKKQYKGDIRYEIPKEGTYYIEFWRPVNDQNSESDFKFTPVFSSATVKEQAVSTAENGRSYTVTLDKMGSSVMKLNVAKAGDLKFSFDSTMWKTYMFLYDPDMKLVDVKNAKTSASTGYWDSDRNTYVYNSGHYKCDKALVAFRDSGKKRFVGDVTISVKKAGTYYVELWRPINDPEKENRFNFKASYPSGGTSAGELTGIAVQLSKGSSIQLAGLFFGSEGKIAWSSSVNSVASVSSAGKVTAKAKGIATITAKAGNKSYKITVKVT